MLGVSTPATTTIITNGLAGRPATDRMLSAWKFHLYVETDVVAKKPDKKVAGGPYPGPAWNKTGDISKFYQPVDQRMTGEGEMPYVLPLDKEGNYFQSKINIVVRGKFGENEIERIYSINEKYAPMVVTITNLVNATANKMSVVIESFYRVAKRAHTKVKNFRLKG